MLVHRTQISAVERHDFELAVRNCGRDPGTFKVELFVTTLVAERATLRRVHIIAGGAAAQYEATDASSWMHKFARHLAMGVFG